MEPVSARRRARSGRMAWWGGGSCAQPPSYTLRTSSDVRHNGCLSSWRSTIRLRWRSQTNAATTTLHTFRLVSNAVLRAAEVAHGVTRGYMYLRRRTRRASFGACDGPLVDMTALICFMSIDAALGASSYVCQARYFTADQSHRRPPRRTKSRSRVIIRIFTPEKLTRHRERPLFAPLHRSYHSTHPTWVCGMVRAGA